MHEIVKYFILTENQEQCLNPVHATRSGPSRHTMYCISDTMYRARGTGSVHFQLSAPFTADSEPAGHCVISSKTTVHVCTYQSGTYYGIYYEYSNVRPFRRGALKKVQRAHRRRLVPLQHSTADRLQESILQQHDDNDHDGKTE